VATLESGGNPDGWRPAPRFAPLDGERPAASHIPRMPTLGIFTVTRLARRMKARLRARLRRQVPHDD
jgi:hypothetical protein